MIVHKFINDKSDPWINLFTKQNKCTRSLGQHNPSSRSPRSAPVSHHTRYFDSICNQILELLVIQWFLPFQTLLIFTSGPGSSTAYRDSSLLSYVWACDNFPNNISNHTTKPLFEFHKCFVICKVFFKQSLQNMVEGFCGVI